MLLLPAPCCYFWMLLLSPWHAACHLKIFARSGCFLGKEFKKCNKTLKADWLPSNVFLLFLKVSQICGLLKCTSAWHSLRGCQVCKLVGSQGNVTHCSQSRGDFQFNKKQTSFGESRGIVPYKLAVRKWSLTKLMGCL